MSAIYPNDKRLRVFVVDDYTDTAKSMSLLLRLEGYDVDSFENALDVVRALESTRPDAVLLDIAMPGMTGWEIARWMHTQSHLAGVPVIAVSGLGRPCDEEQSRAAGFADHLLKPVDPRQLCETIRRVCSAATART